ncbi:MAG: 50S ribosomal protein L29 [Bacteriovoracaceae bacterium]|nr:50S ribosomal protein L29 [Bacteriovoracaceae bacterium]
MDMNEISKMDSNTLGKKITEAKAQLFNLKFQKHTSGIQKPNDLKVLKKDIARMSTALTLKKKSE